MVGSYYEKYIGGYGLKYSFFVQYCCIFTQLSWDIYDADSKTLSR